MFKNKIYYFKIFGVLDEPKKGELKLRIKRITTTPVILNSSSTVSNPSLNSTGNSSFLSALSIDAVQQQQLSVKVPLISPDARITRRTAAILKNSPTIRETESKPALAPALSSINAEDLYDSQDCAASDNVVCAESDEETVKCKRNCPMEIPSTVKTLAQIRDKILEKKKKKRTSDEFISADFKGKVLK